MGVIPSVDYTELCDEEALSNLQTLRDSPFEILPVLKWTWLSANHYFHISTKRDFTSTKCDFMSTKCDIKRQQNVMV